MSSYALSVSVNSKTNSNNHNNPSHNQGEAGHQERRSHHPLLRGHTEADPAAAGAVAQGQEVLVRVRPLPRPDRVRLQLLRAPLPAVRGTRPARRGRRRDLGVQKLPALLASRVQSRGNTARIIQR